MSITLIFALVVVAATIYALIKRYETRLVLITAGLAMALFSLKPMVAFLHDEGLAHHRHLLCHGLRRSRGAYEV